MADRLDIAKFKVEQGLKSGVTVPDPLAAGLAKLGKGIADDVAAKAETRQKFKESSAQDIRDLRALRAKAEEEGGDITAVVPGTTTLANYTLKNLDNFIQDAYTQQEIVTSGLGGPFAVRDYNIFKSNQQQTWQAFKGKIDNAEAEMQETIKRAQGYTKADGTVVPPVAGDGEAAMQRYQSLIQDLENTELVSGPDGMGIVNVYKTEYDSATGLQKRIEDENGDPIINTNISGTSVMGMLNKENSRWSRTDVQGSVDAAFDPAKVAEFDTIVDMAGFTGGSREDNIRRNPMFKQYSDTFIENTLPNNRAISSTLTDNYNGQFVQLDPNQTKTGKVDGKFINIDEKISVSVLDGYDKDGKPIMKTILAPKYIEMELSKANGQLVVKTTDEHKQAASGIVRGAVDAKLPRSLETGEAIKQFDPYRETKTKAKAELDSGVDLFKQVEISYGGTDQEVKAATENLMIKSGFKFNKTLSEKQQPDRGGDELIISQTYQVDKGDGVFKSFEVTLMNPNPKYKKEEQANLRKGMTGYEPQFIPVSKEEYEDKMYELFKGRDDQTSVQKARDNYKLKNKSYNPTGTFNTKGNRDMSVKTQEEVDVAEVPAVSLATAVSKGGPTLLADIKSSDSYKDLVNNTFNDTKAEFKALAATLQSKFNNMASLQGAGQGGDIKIISIGEKIIVKKGGVEIFRDGNDDLGNEGLVEAAMTEALKSLPGQAAGTRTRNTEGGVEVDEYGIPIQ